MIDQAGKLRTLVNQDPAIQATNTKQPEVYSILSGKGGVGKTSIAVNMGIAMSRMGLRVLILDADIGMGNVNILLGETVRHDIMDALKGTLTLKDAIVRSVYGIDVLLGGSELFGLENMESNKHESILQALTVLEEYDVILIDNGAGIHKHSLAFAILGDEVILVTTPEPTAITDAYRVLKIVSLYKLKSSVKVIVNQVLSEENGRETFEKLHHTAHQFLKLNLEFSGSVFSDVRVNRAVMEQVPFVVSQSGSLAGKGIQTIVEGLMKRSVTQQSSDVLSRIGNRILRLFG